jgi:cell division protein FtsB
MVTIAKAIVKMRRNFLLANMIFYKSKWPIFILIPIIGWLSLSIIKIKLQENIVNEETGNLEQEISGLEKSNDILEKFIAYMNNPSFLEKEARIKLNYKAPGEEVALVYQDENKKASSSEDFENAPNYIKWWRYLVGN